MRKARLQPTLSTDTPQSNDPKRTINKGHDLESYQGTTILIEREFMIVGASFNCEDLAQNIFQLLDFIFRSDRHPKDNQTSKMMIRL